MTLTRAAVHWESGQAQAWDRPTKGFADVAQPSDKQDRAMEGAMFAKRRI